MTKPVALCFVPSKLAIKPKCQPRDSPVIAWYISQLERKQSAAKYRPNTDTETPELSIIYINTKREVCPMLGPTCDYTWVGDKM